MHTFRTVLALSFLAFASTGVLAQPINLEEVEKRVIELSNEARKQQGLAPLSPSVTLHSAATHHSEDMQKFKFFAHTNPQDPTNTLSRRLKVAGSTSLASAENIFQCEGYKPEELAKMAVQSWLTSPGHRRNLLDPSYNRIGVGIVGGKDGYYFTQDFAQDSIEIVGYTVTRNENGFQLKLNARVVDGPKEGALLFQGKRVANWTANGDGEFEIDTTVPALGELQIGQTVAPRQWTINAVFLPRSPE